MDLRTIGAIALRLTGNGHDSHYLLSLHTGRIIHRNRWTEVPMPKDVIGRVERMIESQLMNHIVFGDRSKGKDTVEEEVEVQ